MNVFHQKVTFWLTFIFSCSAYLQKTHRQFNRSHELSSLLKDIMTVTLSDENILFICDPEVEHFIDVREISSLGFTSLKSYMFVSWAKFNDTLYQTEKYFLRGSTFIIFLLYHKDPTHFLNSVSIFTLWNPQNLVLLGIESTVPSFTVASHDVVQRSLFISLVERLENGTNGFVVYQIKHKIPGKSNFTRYKRLLGIYSTDNFESRTEFFGPVHFDLAGGVLGLASWCDDKPFIQLYPGKADCEGVSVDLLSIIANKHKFAYDVQHKTPDGHWGSKENGIWNGMLADLMYNGKQLVVNYFLLTEDRYNDFDTTYPYFSEGFGFIIKNPPSRPEWLGLFYPFSTFVWILFFCTATVATATMAMILYSFNETQSCNTAFLQMLAAVVRQSYPESTKSSWVRMWTVMWQLSAFVISLAYTSNLVAFLTVPVVPHKIETVDALAASNLRIMMQDYGNFLPSALRVSEDKSLRSLGGKMEMFPYEDNSYCISAFPKVLAGTHALVDTYSYLFLVRYAAGMHEQTYFMRETVYPGYLTWLLPKNTPYTAAISSELQRLVESGIIAQLYKKHMIEKIHDKQKVSPWQELHMKHLQGPFIILVFGLLISTASFAGELLCQRRVRSRGLQRCSASLPDTQLVEFSSSSL